MYTKEDVTKGLELAKHWYEGHKLEELAPDQLVEAIEKAMDKVREEK